MEEWNCIKSKVESIYNDNGTRTEKYISEYVFVGDKLVDSVKNGEINDEEDYFKKPTKINTEY